MNRYEEERLKLSTLMIESKKGQDHLKRKYPEMKKLGKLPDCECAVEILDAFYNLRELQLILIHVLTSGKADFEDRKSLIRAYATVDLDRNIIIDTIGIDIKEIENFKNGVIE